MLDCYGTRYPVSTVSDVASLAAFKGELASFSMLVVDELVDIAFFNLSS